MQRNNGETSEPGNKKNAINGQANSFQANEESKQTVAPQAKDAASPLRTGGESASMKEENEALKRKVAQLEKKIMELEKRLEEQTK